MPTVTKDKSEIVVTPEPEVIPEVECGDTVIWYQGGEISRPHVAIVVVSGQALGLSVIRENFKDILYVDGVRHMNDPYVVEVAKRSQGLWDLTPAAIRYRKLEGLLGELLNK